MYIHKETLRNTPLIQFRVNLKLLTEIGDQIISLSIRRWAALLYRGLFDYISGSRLTAKIITRVCLVVVTNLVKKKKIKRVEDKKEISIKYGR